MKPGNTLVLLLLLVFTLSCSAGNSDIETVKQLMNEYFPGQKKLNNQTEQEYKWGDFNGDGIKDILVLFRPEFNPVETDRFKVSKPWVYPWSKSSKKLYKSIAIFNGSKSGWNSDAANVFVLLDTVGVLETPSFKLILSKTTDKDYTSHSQMLPVKVKGDLVIIPTEAGIDTYIYWDRNEYKLYEPEEMP